MHEYRATEPEFESGEVKNVWFVRGGLTPLYMDQVLQEMQISGDVLSKGDLIDPTSGRMYQMLRRVQHMVSKFELLSLQENADDTLILKTLLEDRANDVIKTVSESNWTSTCILTMGKFRSICKGSAEASAVLSYPSGCRKAQYFSIRKNDFIEDFLFPADGGGVNVVGDDGFVAGTIESHDSGLDIQKMLLHNPSNDDNDVEARRQDSINLYLVVDY